MRDPHQNIRTPKTHLVQFQHATEKLLVRFDDSTVVGIGAALRGGVSHQFTTDFAASRATSSYTRTPGSGDSTLTSMFAGKSSSSLRVSTRREMPRCLICSAANVRISPRDASISTRA